MICSKCQTTTNREHNRLFVPCERHRVGWTIMLNEETNEVEVLPEEGWQ